MELSLSDWISIICSVVSLFVTIIIFVLQMKQSKRMEDFEYKLDEREEQRREATIKAEAVTFISKYYSDRGLIPLCAIATMHNNLFYYHRDMYREFCCKTTEVQNKILEYCKLDLRVKQIEDLFGECIEAVNNVIHTKFPEDVSPFYEGGKYVLHSLEYYGNEKIPVERIKYSPAYMDTEFRNIFVGFDGFSSYEMCITDMLNIAFNSSNTSEDTICKLEKQYGFQNVSEIEACQFATVLAKYIAIYASENKTDKIYGTPGGYAGESIETMEDIFLLALFEIYTNLILRE